MTNERYVCAIRTLYVMLIHERWYEAKQIVEHEIDWLNDPEPPEMVRFQRTFSVPVLPGRVFYSAWPAIRDAMERKCNAR